MDALAAARPGGSLIGAVRASLAAVGDPAKAGPMQAYMKSMMPFRGVPMPLRRRLSKGLFEVYPLVTRDVWAQTVRAMWDGATHREERYVAIALTGVQTAREWQDVEALPLYEHLIVTGAWWDYVDELAIRRVGPILRNHPGDVAPIVRRWATDDDLWRRRTAILAQVSAKAATDVDLLADVIESNLDGAEITRDFFVRKGIGWALREYAKTDPDWVRSFVRTHEALSPLSVREAMKHL